MKIVGLDTWNYEELNRTLIFTVNETSLFYFCRLPYSFLRPLFCAWKTQKLKLKHEKMTTEVMPEIVCQLTRASRIKCNLVQTFILVQYSILGWILQGAGKWEFTYPVWNESPYIPSVTSSALSMETSSGTTVFCVPGIDLIQF